MLLHVIAAAVDVNQSVNAAALLNRCLILENVEDLPILFFHHLGHAQSVAPVSRLSSKDPTRIKDLATACGIKRSPIKN